MVALLGLVGFVGFILGLISLFRPLTALRIQNRKQAGIVLGVSFGVLLVAGALTPLEEDAGTSTPATTVEQQGTTTTMDSAETTVPTTESPTTTMGASTTTTDQATTATIEPTTTTTEDLPGIGDPVRDGKFEFVVTGFEEPGKIYDPDDTFEDEAVGEWFIVFMTVENIGDESQSFSAGDQKVLWDDKEFDAEGFTWNGTSFEELNPGIVLEATVMFDMPPAFPEGGAGSVLELHDSFLSGGVLVYL